MSTLREVQNEARTWRARNFPDHTIDQQFMGMAEEMGEMAHALLKHEQGIREIDDEAVVDLVADAWADWVIFSMGILDKLGIDANDALITTWVRVKHRDWVGDPHRGGE